LADFVAILDFGSQYTQLIARRVREQKVYCEILSHDTSAEHLKELAPRGIILSGGPAGVYEEEAPPRIMAPSLPPLDSLEPQELYSMWCFVKLMDVAVAAGLQLEEENMTSAGENEVLVRFKEGSEMTFSTKGVTVRMFKGKTYGREPPFGSYTTPKKASLAIEVIREEETPRVIILEPRYDEDYTREMLEAGDLDKLQVLRDSIVDLRSETLKRLVSSCLVVHPTVTEPVVYDGLGSMTFRPGGPIDQIVELLEGLSR